MNLGGGLESDEWEGEGEAGRDADTSCNDALLLEALRVGEGGKMISSVRKDWRAGEGDCGCVKSRLRGRWFSSMIGGGEVTGETGRGIVTPMSTSSSASSEAEIRPLGDVSLEDVGSSLSDISFMVESMGRLSSGDEGELPGYLQPSY